MFYIGNSLNSIALHSFVGALLSRFFIGFVEAAFFPGALVWDASLTVLRSNTSTSSSYPNGTKGMKLVFERPFCTVVISLATPLVR